ncbi:hypothetical protein AYO41_01470 [Verrucomicrobia bacterium SCGC AG-212-E04]|nr:hypothetical protein AYO41_01470 [Verrucomicrobia bacterium SCGC AG-212-E04]
MLRGGAIGDFVVTLPLLDSLRRAFPDEQLELVAHASIASLAVAGGLADAIHPIDSADFAPFFAHSAELPAHWSERFRRAARVISFLHDPGEVLAANIRRSGAASWMQGPHRPADGGGLAARQFAAPIEHALGLTPGNPAEFRLRLDCAAHEEAEMDLVDSRWIAIHPGSGSPRKNWPVARWIEVANSLLAGRKELRLLFVGGEADGLAIREIEQALPRQRIRILENAPLPVVAARIASCERFLGHDSGISHLAASTGIPCLLLFGPSDATVWSPPQPQVRIIPSPGGHLGELPVTLVLAALASAA